MKYDPLLKRKNPFEILGITPQMVKELDSETLFKIIKSNYRILQMRYHPDRGGDTAKVRELNLAFELLNLEKNPQTFEFYRKKYLERVSRKTLKNRLEELESAFRKLTFYNELLKESFWRYINQVRETYLNLSKEKGIYLKVFDIVTHSNFSYRKTLRKSLFFKEFFVFKDAVFLKKEKKSEWLNNYFYIGVIKRDYIEPWVLLEREPGEEGYLKSSIKEEIFVKECLVFLNAQPLHGSYVFFYSPEKKRVILEGSIIKTEPILKKEVSLLKQ